MSKLAVILIPLAAVVIFLNGMFGDFVFDDIKLVKENESLGSVRETIQALNIFSDRWENETVRANYRPVRFLSYAVDWQVSRLLWPDRTPVPPYIFHLHNILLHALNSLLVFLILRRITGGDAVPAFLALVWALHPLPQRLSQPLCQS